MPRSYQLKERADSQDQTRQRIIEAAIELHQDRRSRRLHHERHRPPRRRRPRHRLSPLPRTSSPSPAPCSGLFYFHRHPLPDPKKWQAISDPAERLSAGLRDTYTFFSTTEAMIGHVLADARDHPVMKPYHALWNRAADILLQPLARARQSPQTGSAPPSFSPSPSKPGAPSSASNTSPTTRPSS